MTTKIDFLPSTAELKPYPLHLRQNLAADRDRLSDLARELGYDERALVYVALEELRAYRHCLRETRQSLADSLAERGVEWNPDVAGGSQAPRSVSL
jgi:hypothetical protein